MQTFFDAIRPLFGGKLTAKQVQGMEAIIDAGQGLPVPHLANVLAQVKRETGGGMMPVKETVYAYSKNKNPTDRAVIKRLDSAWNKGQLSWVKSPYWRTGYFGRGQIQITHEDNYRKLSAVVGVDLVASPAKALELPISARIAVNGMASGIFTGRKLSDYNGPAYDHYGARDIVNGDKGKRDRGAKLTVGEKIAADARAFEAALEVSNYNSAPKADWSPPAPPADEVPKGFLAWLLGLFGK